MKHKNIVFLWIAVIMLLAGLTACAQGKPTAMPQDKPTATIATTPTPEPSPTPTPRPILTISSIFPGEEPKGLPAVFEMLNERLAAEIYGKLELMWTPEEGYDEAIATAVTAGSVDFAWIDSSVLPEYVQKQLVSPLDELVASYGLPILDNTNSALLESMRFDGKLMGIPSAGNMPLCNTGAVLISRDDLRQKYGLARLDSLNAIEQYFRTIKENEPGLTPVAAKNAVFAIMKAYGPEELLPGTGNSVVFKVNEDGSVVCLPLQDAEGFKGAAARVRAWYTAGWLPKDMPAVKDGGAMVAAGTAATASGRAMSAVALQQASKETAPEAALTEAPVFGSVKYLESDGGSALCLAAGSKNPETVVQFWAWVLSSQDNYDLLCYGVEHVNFEIADGRISLLDESYSSFPTGVFDNMKYRRFPAGISDEYIMTLQQWNDGAKASPLMGFEFDPAAVKDELNKIKAVYALYGAAIQAGSSDTATLLKEFSGKMKAAGQNKIVTEAQAQIDNYLRKRS